MARDSSKLNDWEAIMGSCAVVECSEDVSKKGHTFCFEHWKADRDGELSQCQKCGKWKDGDKPLCLPCFKASRTSGGDGYPLKQERGGDPAMSVTQLAETFGITSQKMNLVFAELGWITKDRKGWIATRHGIKQGAIQKEHFQSGVPYVQWPDAIKRNHAVVGSIRDVLGQEVEPASAQPSPATAPNVDAGFREKFPATHRTTDGHMVRSRAELLIDNWLYVNGIVHAYERKVPVEEEVYCDFWIPTGKVYIEYWGMEDDPKYAERKRVKKAVYEKYGYNLIELGDDHIRNLDDHLPRLLLKFNVSTP